MASTDPAKPGDHEVFGSLPSSRPERRSAKRATRTATATAPTAKAKPKAGAKPKTAGKPKAASRAKASARPKAAARPRPKAAAPPRSPVPAAGYATPRSDEEPGRGGLLGTAVQAAGELTQIGLAAGSRAISSALSRLPRP